MGKITRYLVELKDGYILADRLTTFTGIEDDVPYLGFKVQVDHLWRPEDFAEDCHVIVQLAGVPYTDGFGKARQGKPKGVIRGRLLRIRRMDGTADQMVWCRAEFALSSQPEHWLPGQQIIQEQHMTDLSVIVSSDDVGPLLTGTAGSQSQIAQYVVEQEYEEDVEDERTA